MSRFDVPAVVEDVVWTMKLGDYNRATNRASINDLFNGMPPFSAESASQNNQSVNVNFLDSTKMAHDARHQFNNAFLKPGKFFTVSSIDRGDKNKRDAWATTITNKLNRIMKRSLPYYETRRAEFANLVLHGIGPSIWQDRDMWRCRSLAVGDVLLPAGTYVSMDNLPFLAVFRSYTAAQLQKMTSGPKVDPGWNMPLVKQLIESAKETILSSGLSTSESWSPEQMSERYKSDQGMLATDNAPTIDCWDFYFWDDTGKESGWYRRIVLDTNLSKDTTGSTFSKYRGDSMKSKYGTRDQFLYNSKNRVYCSDLQNIICTQFADLSAVAPFRYHSVRSLGFLLYAVCELQNRLMCQFNDALFEQLMQYFRVQGMDDVERVLKIQLRNKGFVDESVKFIPQAERWQVNAGLAQMGIALNRQIIGSHSSSYTQATDYGKKDTPKTATEVMAEVHSTQSLVSAALNQASEYSRYQYIEIARRFCKKNSRDPDVRKFRVQCLRDLVPAEVLDSECWEIEPEKVMGGGNKMVELAVAKELMSAINMFDPESQRRIKSKWVLSLTDDSGEAEILVPDKPVKVTDAVHDAQSIVGSLWAGFEVALKTGMNHIEYVDTLLGEMALKIQQVNQRGGVAGPNEIQGFYSIANHIGQHIQIISQDKNENQRVKQYGDVMGKMMNEVKAYEQRLQEMQQKKAQEGNGQQDAELQAKLRAMQVQAEAKAANTRESHAQRTGQRQAQTEIQMQHDAEKHALEMRKLEDLNAIEYQKTVIDGMKEKNKTKAQEISE